MRYNPCGRVVDISRRPYTTVFRPWDGSQEEVELVWYVVPWSSEFLGFPSRIQNLEWSSHPYDAEGVGEVYDAPRIYNGQWEKPIVAGEHFCGDRADFMGFSTKDEEIPPVIYNDADLPMCCQPPFIGQGGAVASGTAEVEVVSPSYCTNYNADLAGFDVIMLPTIAGQEWSRYSPTLDVTFTLRSPDYPGNTDWTLTVVVEYIPETHNYLPASPGWDGHGGMIFNDTFVPPLNFILVGCIP